MRFLAPDEARVLEKKLRRQMADQSKPKLVLYYSSGHRDYSSAANAITKSLGEFTAATLHFLFCVTGDGWDEHLVTHEQWSKYREWRTADGESRRLYDAPGHQFEPDEAEKLSKVIEFALALGWDALIAATPGRQLALLSHDDRMEIYRGFQWRSLAEKLIKLGYWHR
jgi:hypothetical protein